MARIEIKEPREQEAHFGLYRTSAGGDQSIFVRRKVGDPTDYMHTKSKKVKQQRQNLALASQHYSHLTPSQKAVTRHQMEEVPYQQSHGKTNTKLLQGRQLFISKEMLSLANTGAQLLLPLEICIMLVDEDLKPLEGELWLLYWNGQEWVEIDREELYTGSWLFTETPRGQQAYRPYGMAEGYFDPMLPELQAMIDTDLPDYHYHILLLPVAEETLYPSGDTALKDLLPADEPHWPLVLYEDAVFIPPNGGGNWGWWLQGCVWKHWYPWGEQADLYTFTDPLYAAQHIAKLVIWYLVGRDNYPFGQARSILKTHGITYYGDYNKPQSQSVWYQQEYIFNPFTNLEWTREEVQELYAGISLDKLGSFGRIMCDRMCIQLHYTE